jgi:hypothetical protein
MNWVVRRVLTSGTRVGEKFFADSQRIVPSALRMSKLVEIKVMRTGGTAKLGIK